MYTSQNEQAKAFKMYRSLSYNYMYMYDYTLTVIFYDVSGADLPEEEADFLTTFED